MKQFAFGSKLNRSPKYLNFKAIVSHVIALSYQYNSLWGQPWGSALDVEELLHPDVGAEAGLSDHVAVLTHKLKQMGQRLQVDRGCIAKR